MICALCPHASVCVTYTFGSNASSDVNKVTLMPTRSSKTEKERHIESLVFSFFGMRAAYTRRTKTQTYARIHTYMYGARIYCMRVWCSLKPILSRAFPPSRLVTIEAEGCIFFWPSYSAFEISITNTHIHIHTYKHSAHWICICIHTTSKKKKKQSTQIKSIQYTNT